MAGKCAAARRLLERLQEDIANYAVMTKGVQEASLLHLEAQNLRELSKQIPESLGPLQAMLAGMLEQLEKQVQADLGMIGLLLLLLPRRRCR